MLASLSSVMKLNQSNSELQVLHCVWACWLCWGGLKMAFMEIPGTFLVSLHFLSYFFHFAGWLKSYTVLGTN